jgi:hypothetical protein
MGKTQWTWEENVEMTKLLTDSDGGRSYDKAGACNYFSGNVEQCSMALNKCYMTYYDLWWRCKHHETQNGLNVLQMEGL